ncbi:MAG: hypothetical protein JWO06_2116, partial [Bacteroidota bacterium]|nr:hypothetical protein [Bacteroidota bacterium]
MMIISPFKELANANKVNKRKTFIPLLGILLVLTIQSCIKPRQENVQYFKDHASKSLDTSGGVVV